MDDGADNLVFTAVIVKKYSPSSEAMSRCRGVVTFSLMSARRHLRTFILF